MNVSDHKQKIMLVANTSWYLYNFRLPLARRLRDEGLEVVLVSPKDSYVERLRSEGFQWRELKKLSRKGMNPFREALALWEIMSLYREEQPRAAHHFTIKCVLYGTIAAKLTGVRSVVNAVTGLGHIFLGDGLATRAIRPFVRFLYSRILRARRGHVVFQNPDDLDTFMSAGLVSPEKTVIIRSSGVCTQKFSPRPGDPDTPAEKVPVVLMAGRLLKEKGIYDFVEAARIVKSTHDVCFQVAGTLDPGNPSSVTTEQLKEWQQEGAVDFLGHVDAMDEVLALSDIVALPSYREGTPKALLEAAASGKPIVATDVPGCREIVQHDFNGLLVPVRDPKALAQALLQLIDDRKEAVRMGLNGRHLVEKEFSVEKVVHETLEVYSDLGITR